MSPGRHDWLVQIAVVVDLPRRDEKATTGRPTGTPVIATRRGTICVRKTCAAPAAEAAWQRTATKVAWGHRAHAPRVGAIRLHRLLVGTSVPVCCHATSVTGVVARVHRESGTVR